MNKPEEILRKEIRSHPKSKVSRAYKLGQMDGIEKPEITTQEGRLPDDHATIVKKRGNYRVFSW